MFEGVDAAAVEQEDRSGWPIEQRLEHRIIDGNRDGLEADLEEQLESRPALSIVNDVLLEGMKVVGDLFGRGEMQLPFVLQSAETMKAAVAYLEPHMEKADAGGKGRVVLGTVKGDVHDIGKNLVDIILTNNGYEVHNIGIKAPLSAFVEKANEVEADAIGMSGLLVKSTLIMRENLQEMNDQGLAEIPVLLGGAALTRTYVERDLREVYDGRLFYGKDAFEGLHTMDQLMEGKKSGVLDPDFGRAPGGRILPPRRSEMEAERAVTAAAVRSDVAADVEIFTPPFLGSRVAKGVALDDIAAYINETALFRNQWQFRPDKSLGENDADFKDRIRPILRAQLDEAKAEGWLVPAVIYGYFPVNSDGNDLIVWTDDDRRNERLRFTFPRQRSDRHLCISDFFRSDDSGDADYAAFHVVTVGELATAREQELFAADQLPGVPPHPWPLGGDDRGTGGALAPPHPRGMGLRERGRPVAGGTLPPAVPRVALLVGLSGVSRPGRPGQARRAARVPPHRDEAHRGVPARARAEHLGDHRAPPRGEVLRRLISRSSARPRGTPAFARAAHRGPTRGSSPASIPGREDRRPSGPPCRPGGPHRTPLHRYRSAGHLTQHVDELAQRAGSTRRQRVDRPSAV